MGQDIRAQPGDAVGREIRTAMVEGGAPDEDAVYVHREHVRVEREGDSFYLERLGQNSLKVNGEPVGQHDRAEIGNGDVVSFSEVVTADVRLE
jgi:pSer/pThr/pTyr-binding forkhead associated (FHA) protein